MRRKEPPIYSVCGDDALRWSRDSMIGTEGRRVWRPKGICGVGCGRAGPKSARPIMGVGGRTGIFEGFIVNHAPI